MRGRYGPGRVTAGGGPPAATVACEAGVGCKGGWPPTGRPRAGPGGGPDSARSRVAGRCPGRYVEGARVQLALADPFHEVAIDHDGACGLLDDVDPDAEHDRGVGERDHRLAPAPGGGRGTPA